MLLTCNASFWLVVAKNNISGKKNDNKVHAVHNISNNKLKTEILSTSYFFLIRS